MGSPSDMLGSMRNSIAALYLTLSATVLLASDPSPLQLMDVFQLEYASDPQISPDGNRIAYLRNSFDLMKDRRQSRLWIINWDGSDHRPLLSESGQSAPRWSPDGTRLLFSCRVEGKPQLCVHWLETGQTMRITQLTQPPRNASWSPDGQWVAFNMVVPRQETYKASLPRPPQGAEWASPPRVIERLRNRADGRGYLTDGYQQVFVVPAQGGTHRQLTSGPYDHNGAPVWNPNGRELIFSGNRNPEWEYEFRNSEIYSVSIESGEIQALTSRNGPDRSPAFSPDGKHIAYLGYDDRVQTYQVTQLSVMNRDGSGKTLLSGQLDRSLQDPVWDSQGKGLYFLFDDQGNTKLGYVALQGGQIAVLAGDVGGTSLGRPYRGGSFSVASNGRFAFTQTRPEHPGDLAVGLPGEPRTRRLTALNDDIFSQRSLASVEEIWWESSYDNRRIQGWIVRPPGFDPNTKYPLLLEIHGGPISNYGDRFSAEIQLYAAAGHVVLYANPRGSTSYGEEFGNLLHHNYPGQDYDDLMSGIDAVIARGFIDERNLFVTGGSAGGIMTAWMVGKTDRFRAAVSAKPVINWYSKVLVADNYYAYHNYRYPGSPWENPEAYMRFSPISLVGNVSTPTLLMTGDADLRTPLSEAEQFFHALKLRKVDTALVRIPGASHNIAARPSQLIAKVAYVLDWFERYKRKESGDRNQESESRMGFAQSRKAAKNAK